METEGTLTSAWDQHLASAFAAKSADQALATMTAEPYVDVVQLMIGARGRIELHDFYTNHFLSQISPDMEIDLSARPRSTDSEASLRGNSSSVEDRPLSHARIPEAIMSTAFVLVHGAWLGGWCWKKVTPLLRAAGHKVFAPTLTFVQSYRAIRLECRR
jgi:hypothetical protein